MEEFEMGTLSAKERILKAVQDLPAEAGIEDAMERLYLLLKIDKGLQQADAGETVSHEEAKERLGKWLE
jgi:predicted transcriptional regulator